MYRGPTSVMVATVRMSDGSTFYVDSVNLERRPCRLKRPGLQRLVGAALVLVALGLFVVGFHMINLV